MAEYPTSINVTVLNGTNGVTFTGLPAGNELVITQGDVNGDGFDDYLIGVPDSDAVYVVFGKAGGFPAIVNVSSMFSFQGFVLHGDPGTGFGSAISVGDVTGDGIGDIAIGATGHEYGADGAVYVIKGRSSSGWSQLGENIDVSKLDLSSDKHTDGFGIHGGENFGSEVKFVLVKEEVTNPAFGISGTLDVPGLQVSDGSGGIATYGLKNGNALTQDGLVVDSSGTGELGGDGFGGDATGGDHYNYGNYTYNSYYGEESSGFDCNGDGFEDQLVCDSNADRNGLTDCGAAYVVFGKTSGPPVTFDVATDCDGIKGFCVSGPATDAHLGNKAVAIGDCNGDGFSDFMICQETADSGRGAVYVIFGSATNYGTAGLDLSTLTGANGFKLQGEAAGDQFGYDATCVDDFNGDGFNDIAIGAFGAGSGAGKVYVVFGAPSASWASGVINISTLMDGNRGFSITGAAAGDHASIVDPGDMNADGFSDIGIAAPGAGEAYMLFGGKPGIAVTRTGTDISQTIRGGDQADTLNGMGGNDLLAGNGGADTLDGGTGFDVAGYHEKTVSVTIILNGATAAAVSVGGSPGVDPTPEDTVRNIEGIIGGSAADTLTGDNLANFFRGNGGQDVIDGGAGIDTVDFSDKTGKLFVALDGANNTNVTVSNATDDTVRNVENVIGASNDDFLEGDGLANILVGARGKDLLYGGEGNDTLFGGLGDDSLIGAGGQDIMDGGADQDTADYSGLFGGASIEVGLKLAGDSIVKINGITEDTLRNIENFLSASGNDTITGSSADNVINGGTGDDTLNGGGGKDTVSYQGRSSAIVLTLNGATNATVTANGTPEDTIKNFENATGGQGADTLTGDGLANVLDGGSDGDTLNGGGGNDTLIGNDGIDTINGGNGDDQFLEGRLQDNGHDIMNGGDGIDTLSYSARFVVSGGSIVVTLNGSTDATVTVGGSAEDTIRNIENVSGGLSDDNLTGDGFDNVLMGGTAGVNTSGDGNDTLSGMGGNDTLVGGIGTDILNGGTGIDTASYAGATGGVTVSLAISGSQFTGGAGFDTLSKIENLTGSAVADTLTGNGGRNIVTGGDGSDSLDGGAGIDTANYDDKTQAVSVKLKGATATAVTVGGVAEDTIMNFENVTGGSGKDILTGDGGANTLTGGAGGDTLVGGAGDDRLAGGLDNDQLFGGLGRDVMSGDDGNDRFVFKVISESGTTASIADKIVGFATGDIIDVHLIDAKPVVGDQAFKLDTDDSRSVGEIHQTPFGADLLLEFNTAGDFAPEMEILVTGPTTFLGGADFSL